MKLTKLIFFLFLASSSVLAQPKKIAFEKFGVADGLPEEAVSGMVQDDKGFIWATTQNGLVKYDGYRFKVYKYSQSNHPDSLQLRNLWGGILKLPDGKLWIGGHSDRTDGLASFDPATEKFTQYCPFGAKPGLNSNYIYLINADQQGKIWFAQPSEGWKMGYFDVKTKKFKNHLLKISPSLTWTAYGVYAEMNGTIWATDAQFNLRQYNKVKDSFEIIIAAGSNMMGKPDSIKFIMAGKGGRVFLTGRNAVYVYNTKSQKITDAYWHETPGKFALAGTAYEDARGHYWICMTGGNIIDVDPNRKTSVLMRYGQPPLNYTHVIPNLTVFRPQLETKEGLWLQTYMDPATGAKFFLFYSFTTGKFTYYDKKFNEPNNDLPLGGVSFRFFLDRTNLLWMYTRPNMYREAPKKKQIAWYKYEENSKSSLPSDSVLHLFEDTKKRFWVGTRNGLALYEPGSDQFKVFQFEKGNPRSLSDNRITKITEDKSGNILVSTANGLSVWRDGVDGFSRYLYDKEKANGIWFANADRLNRWWVSNDSKKEVYVFDSKGKILKTFSASTFDSANKNPRIGYFYEDKRGNVWLGDGYENKCGLYLFNERENKFKHFLPIVGDTTSLSSDEIRFFVEDDNNHLWIGTDGGLNIYNSNKQNFTRVNLGSFVSGVKDKSGNLWFGTYSGFGLLSFNKQGKSDYFGEDKGLLHNDCIARTPCIDQSGRIWIPTQRGLSVFDPGSKTFSNYLERDGLQKYDRYYSQIALSNGEVWLGGYQGLNRIIPSQLAKKDTSVPTLVITQVLINDSVFSKPDGKVFTRPVPYTDKIELSYSQKDISFSFVGLHYLRPQDNLYSWKLDNYDAEWSTPSRQRTATYTNLSPGTYIFRVKASNADGVWNEKETTMTVVILPPWWRTWWAYALYVLVFGFAVWKYIGYRSKKLKKENKILEEKVQHRTAQLQSTIENLKTTQAQLVQSEKMASLGELTAGIAHEIQNPLNFINNFSEVTKELTAELKDELDSNNIDAAKQIADDIHANAHKIVHHGKRADAIVKNMLQHSRAGSGKKEPTDINALADEYLRLSYHGLRAKDKSFNAQFKTSFDENVGKINVMGQDVGRVLLNLYNNAFYAVNEKKKKYDESYQPMIEVRTKRDGDKVVVHVKDNGTGMPQYVVKKIYQPFFSTKPTGEGTGLGLSLSYDIITKGHGGDLKVETKEGEGTEFIITLKNESSL